MDDASAAAHAPTPTAETWRAPALDVRGPHGRGPRGADGPPDAGDLWIVAGSLYFAGSASAWSLPLGWLDVPESGLDGLTRLTVRTSDRARAVSLRLARGAEDERGLAAAIRRARLQRPDARDLRALDDLLQLAAPDLRALDAEASALEQSQDADALTDYAAHAERVANRVRTIWLPYWGEPASRLRDATLGALRAVAEGSAASQDADAATRCEQAVRRWRNVVDDLRLWCGAPSAEATPPAPRRPSLKGIASARDAGPVAAPAASAAPVAAAAVPATPQMPPAAAPAPPAQPAPAQAAYAAQNTPQPPAASEPAQPVAPAPIPAVAAAPEPPRNPPLENAAPSPAPQAPPPLANPAPPIPAPFVYPAGPKPPARADLTPQPPVAQPPPPAPAPAPVAPPPVAPQSDVPADGIHGSGEMTRLFARATPNGTVARKMLTAAEAAKPSVAGTFLQLGRRFQGVQHPSLVRILDVGNEPGTNMPYIDMEWVQGESLGVRAARGPMAQDLALRLLGSLAEAIDTLHFAGVVHSDIRPHNVIIDAAGRPVLLEPSIACDHALEEERGQVFGDPPYLTPEHARGDEPVARGDVYGLGALAFLLLAGRPPFAGPPEEVFAALLDKAAPPLSSVLPGTPAEASDTLAAALAKQPEDRPASAVAFIGGLRRALLEGGSGVSPTERIVRPAPPIAQQTPPAPAPFAQQPPAPAPQPAAPQPEQRSAPSPLGRAAPSPLGGAPSPLGGATPPRREEPPDDGIDKTIITRPRD
jgi:serine/threonine protein kinase